MLLHCYIIKIYIKIEKYKSKTHGLFRCYKIETVRAFAIYDIYFAKYITKQYSAAKSLS